MYLNTGAKKIFVADDDPSITEVVRIILESNGYTVLTPSSVETILSEIQQTLPDLVMLDLWMSGVEGKKIAQTLKSAPNTSQIPVVVFSAHNEGAQIAKAAGAEDYLAKPFDIDVLLSTIQKYVS